MIDFKKDNVQCLSSSCDKEAIKRKGTERIFEVIKRKSWGNSQFFYIKNWLEKAKWNWNKWSSDSSVWILN